MSKAEILAEFTRLSAADRLDLFARLCELQDNDLRLGLSGPSAEERSLLDAELAAFHRDKNPGRPWREVINQLL